jgi:xylulose-5-phosphate/fructose-6-phosphate phosphoketolase
MAAPLSAEQVARMQAYWDAANYLVVGQIYDKGRAVPNADVLIQRCDQQLARHHDYVREHLDDMPEVRDWTWTD